MIRIRIWYPHGHRAVILNVNIQMLLTLMDSLEMNHQTLDTLIVLTWTMYIGYH